MKNIQIIKDLPIELTGKTVLYYNDLEPLTVTCSDGTNFSQIDSFTGEKTYVSFSAAIELNYVSAIGALLWLSSDGTLVATNGDNTSLDYWDPKSDIITTPTKDSYTLIAVCIGLGKWAYISWSGLTTPYKWAASNSDEIYNWHPTMVHGNGWLNTMHILTNYPDILSDTIWEEIKTLQDSGIPVYLPSKYELLEVQANICDDIHITLEDGFTSPQPCTYNKNLGMLLNCTSDFYWSSSLYSNGYNYAFYCYFYSGNLPTHLKNTHSNKSIVFIHFGI